MDHFWKTFRTRAKSSKKHKTPDMLTRSVSNAGPELAPITSEVDKTKFGFFR